MNFKVSIYLLFLLLFSSIAISSPCSPKELEQELRRLQLDPAIRSNEQLIDGIEFIYGTDMSHKLMADHPYLLWNSDGSIDAETLQWVINHIWNPVNPFIKYIYMPGDLSSENALDFFVSSMDGSLDARVRLVPIFQNQESAGVYDAILEPKNEAYMLTLFERIYPRAQPDSRKRKLNDYLTHFRKHQEYRIGFNFPPDQKPVIEITGHSRAGSLCYNYGNKCVSTIEIVQHLVQMNLPKNANIELIGCFTACSSMNTLFNKETVEGMFLQGRLNEIFDTDPLKPSFLAHFYDNLKKALPFYSGTVYGYLGQVSNRIMNNVLTIQNTRTTTYAVRIKTTDGDVLLKRDQARLSLSSTF